MIPNYRDVWPFKGQVVGKLPFCIRNRYVTKLAKYWDTWQLDGGVVRLTVPSLARGAVDEQSMQEY